MIQKFKCHKCGETELSFEKLATVRSDVTIRDDGHVEYGECRIEDETIDKSPLFNFTCRDCNWQLHIGPYKIELDADLEYYLSKSFDEIAALNYDYFKKISGEEDFIAAEEDILVDDVV